MMNLYNYKPQKGRDRGYVNCPECHNAIKFCPMCKKDMMLPKAKGRLDFIVMMEWTEVECKQGTESWALNDFSEPQEALINKPTRREHHRWLFLEIGDGRAPKGREAYLIPGDAFVSIRRHLEQEGFKSVRYRATERSRVPEARDTFGRYCLEWIPNRGWVIPRNHEWWNYDAYIPFPDEPENIKDDDEPESRPTATPTRLTMLG